MFRWITLAALLVTTPIPCRAALIPSDLSAPNDQLVTIDSLTGLEWLDVTATQGQSYNSVAAGFGGFVQLGFRYATIGEVSTLYSHAGVINQDGLFHAENAAGALLLINLMGCTNNCNISVDSQGGLAEDEPFSPTAARGPFVAIFADRSRGVAVLSASSISKSQGYQEVGSYLVRPIPEPSISALLSLGLAVLSMTRRSEGQ